MLCKVAYKMQHKCGNMADNMQYKSSKGGFFMELKYEKKINCAYRQIKGWITLNN